MIEKIMKAVKRGNKKRSRNITIGTVIGFLPNAVIDFLILPELLASFGDLNYDVVEMVLADRKSVV